LFIQVYFLKFVVMNFIITNRKNYFDNIGQYKYCDLTEMILPKTISYDSETTGLKFYKGDMFAIQIGTGTNNYLIDLESINIKEVLPYLENKILVMHNSLFDLTWLYKHNFFPWKVRDTFLARKIMYNGLVMKRHDFGTVMEEELGVIYDKSEQKNIAKIKLSTDKAIQYCFNDVDKLLNLADCLHKQIVQKSFVQVYNLHCKWIRACAYMQCCGVPINEQKWQEKCDNDKKELKLKENIIKQYIADKLPEYRKKQFSLFESDGVDLDLLITSSAQMIEVFEKLGINVENPDAATGKSVAEDVIKKTKHEFVDLWLDYQSIKHDVTTFGESFYKNIYEGRLYTSYKPILDTARISAGGKNRDKTEVNDVNTLNIPANEKSRRPFEAKEGFDYIVADYSAQEGVTGADNTGDAAMVSSVINNSCLHCAFARVLYPEIKDLTDEEIIKNHKDKRQASKAPRFTFQFGGGAYTLSQKEGISLEEAMHIENAYKELHAGIYTYGNNKLEEAIKLGYIESALGWKLQLPYFEEFKKNHKWIKSLSSSWWTEYRKGKNEHKELKKDAEYKVQNESAYALYSQNAYNVSQYFKKKGEYFRLVLNNPTQTKAALQTKAATNRVYEHIWKKKDFWKARIALVVHDEINLETQKHLTKEYAEILEYSMIEEGNKLLVNKDLFMKASANIGTNWYESK